MARGLWSSGACTALQCHCASSQSLESGATKQLQCADGINSAVVYPVPWHGMAVYGCPVSWARAWQCTLHCGLAEPTTLTSCDNRSVSSFWPSQLSCALTDSDCAGAAKPIHVVTREIGYWPTPSSCFDQQRSHVFLCQPCDIAETLYSAACVPKRSHSL